MFRQQLYIGLNDKDAHTQRVTEEEAIKVIGNIVEQYDINCYNITKGTGFYKNEKENCLVIEVIDEILKFDNELIKSIKFALNQECIMRVVQKLNAVEFI